MTWPPALSLLLVVISLLVPLTTSLLAHHKAHAATVSVDWVECGDEAKALNPDDTGHLNQWEPVTAGDTQNSPVPAVGYQLGSGLGGKDLNCSGNYQYAWDQYYHKAQWVLDTFSSTSHTPDAPLTQGSWCSVYVWIPTCYTGAHHVHYSLTIASDGGTQSFAFDDFDQEAAPTSA